MRQSLPGFWIPAYAGMTVGGGNRLSPAHPIIPAPLRHSRESGNPHPGLAVRQRLPGFWIPAGAGMTVRAGCCWLVYAGVWIPAFAGMTVEMGMAVGDGNDGVGDGNDGGNGDGGR